MLEPIFAICTVDDHWLNRHLSHGIKYKWKGYGEVRTQIELDLMKAQSSNIQFCGK